MAFGPEIWLFVLILTKSFGGIGVLHMGVESFRALTMLQKAMLVFVICLVLLVVWVWMSQLTASTPQIVDEQGIAVQDSVAELLQVELNGRKQWISIRGWSQEKPVLLFLAGGPGGSQMAAVRHELGELEKHFVVVNWDQLGSAKSYGSAKITDITVDMYIQDGFALTEYLRERFEQEKIYLMGESWGSALGIFLAEKYPEIYHGLIGTGQMVDFVQTEIMDYNLAMEIAVKRNEQKIIQQLQKNGLPPYYGKDVTWKSAVYLNYLSAEMAHNLKITNAGYNTFRDLGSPEYGLLDKLNFIRGIIDTFNHVYPQLYGVDLREGFIKLAVPVYFFLGRHDVNAPISLVEEYYSVLEAPHKEIVWFEHSGHSPWINERELFVEQVLSCFLGKN
jgi:pimeloyl-ACP methyl ester carboxylesterase